MQNFLIIGASSGIGEALADQLSSNHNVFGTYNENQIENKTNVSYHKLNVLEEFDLDFLPEELHGIAYCPGTINLKPFARLSPDSFLEDYKLQVLGAVKVIQACLKKLKNAQQASIVLFSTVAVQTGFNFHTQVAASKGAIEGLTKSLAIELSPRIRVNAIAPSLTKTPLAEKLLSTEDKINANAERHPLKKIGEPADIANMATFLLSEKSKWITGQILKVDGGISTLK